MAIPKIRSKLLLAALAATLGLTLGAGSCDVSGVPAGSEAAAIEQAWDYPATSVDQRIGRLEFVVKLQQRQLREREREILWTRKCLSATGWIPQCVDLYELYPSHPAEL